MKKFFLKSLFGWAIVAFLFVALHATSAKADEEYFEIYPEMFIEDCKVSAYNGDVKARIFDFVAKPLDEEVNLKPYNFLCGCLSNAYFKESDGQNYDVAANYYEWYNVVLEHGSRAREYVKSQYFTSRVQNKIRRNIYQCKADEEAFKQSEVAKTIPQTNSWEAKLVQSYKGLPSWVSGSSMMEKKAVLIAQCMTNKISESGYTTEVMEMARKEIVEVVQADGNWPVAQNIEVRDLAIKAIDECY